MKYLYLSVLLLCFSCDILAQPDQVVQLANIETVSPEAANLGKFGNVPVNYSTGIPNITIPVYEIKIGKINVPISLDYHAGGIKVDEIASPEGLGWVLNYGGIVSRNVLGMPDMDGGNRTGYLAAPTLNQNNYAQLYNNPDFVTNVVTGLLDVQPDVFSYNIVGESGKFVFNQDQSVFQIPITNNKIVYMPGYTSADNVSSFIITNDEGMEFIFHYPEYNETDGPAGQYLSSWKLTKIIDPNTRDTVFFNYTPVPYGGVKEIMRTDSWSQINTVNCGEGYAITDGTFYGADTYSRNHSEIVTNYTNVQHIEGALTEIDWRGGKIKLINQFDNQNVSNSSGFARQDANGEYILNEIDVYSAGKGSDNLIKKVLLDNNHYFLFNSEFQANTSTGYVDALYNPDENNRRLRLDNISFISSENSNTPQVYSIQYDTETNMASRYSVAQDRWGFNDGRFVHAQNFSDYYQETLFEPQTITGPDNGIYTFGTNDRDPDPNFMNACNIKSIQYPTGGKTVFEFEPHMYKTLSEATPVTHSVTCTVSSLATLNSASTTFTFQPDLQHYFQNIRGTFQINPDPGLNGMPSVTIKDETGRIVFSQISSYQTLTTINPFLLQIDLDHAAHTYTITCTVSSAGQIPTPSNPSPQLLATMTVSWEEISLQSQIGGGERIKSITDLDANGLFMGKKLYKYGLNESGLGILMIPNGLINTKSSKVQYNSLCDGGSQVPPNLPSITYYANPIVPFSQISGSSVLYNSVTEYQLSGNDEVNGKTVYDYNVYTDQQVFLAIINNSGYMPTLISNDWQNCHLSEKQVFKSTGDINNPVRLLSDKTYTYDLEKTDNKDMILVTPISIGGYTAANADINWYQLPTGAMVLKQTISNDYDDYDNSVVTTENYYYDDLQNPENSKCINIAQKTSTNSKGETITENYKYPYDFATARNQYQKMVNQNNIGPVVQYQKLNGSAQLIKRNENYTDFNDPYNVSSTDVPFLQPTSIDEQIRSNPADTRVQFNRYDGHGNVTEQQKTNDKFQSYIWDYNSVYPVAKIEGASIDDIAYTSFEADESNSNWSFSTSYPGIVINSGGVTGTNYYLLQSNVITANITLNASRKYIVSYWSQNNVVPCSISGTVGPVKKGATINGWTYYEHEITGVNTATVSGSDGGIDELRLYPEGAQIETYTYSPLIGMTSQCDAANHVTSYEYDDFNRLSVTRNQDGNIIKQYCYNYAGQTTNCDGKANIYSYNLAEGNITFNLVFTNVLDGTTYNISVSQGGNLSISIGEIPFGNYNIQLTSSDNLNHQISIGTDYYYGPANLLTLTNVAIMSGLAIYIPG